MLLASLLSVGDLVLPMALRYDTVMELLLCTLTGFPLIMGKKDLKPKSTANISSSLMCLSFSDYDHNP